MGADRHIENIHCALIRKYEPLSFDQVLQHLRAAQTLREGVA